MFSVLESSCERLAPIKNYSPGRILRGYDQGRAGRPLLPWQAEGRKGFGNPSFLQHTRGQGRPGRPKRKKGKRKRPSLGETGY